MKNYCVALGMCLALTAAPAAAVTVSDPVGDYLPSFAGTQSPDLDVTSFSVAYDGTNFLLGATLAGAIVPGNNALYVIGIDTGTGVNHPFGNIGEPNVTFNQVILLSGATGIATFGATQLHHLGQRQCVQYPASGEPADIDRRPARAVWLQPLAARGPRQQQPDQRLRPENALLRVQPLPSPPLGQ